MSDAEPRRKNHTWTNRQIEFCGRLWRQGLTQNEIADAMAVTFGASVTHNSISRVAMRHRDLMPRRTKEEFREACRRRALDRWARARE